MHLFLSSLYGKSFLKWVTSQINYNFEGEGDVRICFGLCIEKQNV